MDLFSSVADWISGHETLLSGIAALIVLGGVMLTLLIAGWQRVLGLGCAPPRSWSTLERAPTCGPRSTTAPTVRSSPSRTR